MSNSNYENVHGQNRYRTDKNNQNPNYKGRYGRNRDNGGFRIRLSDNEMKSVKIIQETFQLKSTVAVLGFSVRTLSEMLNDSDLKESILKYAQNSRNSFIKNNTKDVIDKATDGIPDPLARPLKVEGKNETQSINNSIDVK